MLDHLTSRQLSEWEAYNRLDPVSKEWRADFRMAYMASLFMNAMVKVFGKRGAQTYKLEDFMPEWDWDEESQQMRPRQSVEEMKAALLSLAAPRRRKAINDKLARKRKPVKKVKQ